MDAVEFIKDLRRMCNHFQCDKCPTKDLCCSFFPSNPLFVETGEDLVRTVEEWAKEHPVKTRQTEFLKIFPKAKVAVTDNREVVLAICPKLIDSTITLPSCVERNCLSECEKDYWLQEVE